MGQEAVWILKAFLLPPGGIVLLGMLGLLLGRRSLVGRSLVALSLVALYLFSTPYIANRLMMGIETIPALTPDQISDSRAQAIVVLGGGRRPDAAEYGGDTVNGLLLERLRYAAYLSRLSGLPVIASGGSGMIDGVPEAVLARQILETEFNTRVAAIEAKSLTTWENATMTVELLRGLEIDRILLVTHAMHMPRAMEMFSRAGLDAVAAAPTVFYHRDDSRYPFSDWLPGPKAMQLSYFALHELLGNLWYRLRHRLGSLAG